jgi:hypothetical protein
VLDVNVLGLVRVTRAALPVLRRSSAARDCAGAGLPSGRHRVGGLARRKLPGMKLVGRPTGEVPTRAARRPDLVIRTTATSPTDVQRFRSLRWVHADGTVSVQGISTPVIRPASGSCPPRPGRFPRPPPAHEFAARNTRAFSWTSAALGSA